MTVFFIALSVQIVLGAFDNLWHHELTEKLPGKRSARTELALHAVREGLYAVVFMAIAWWQWHGLWAWLLGAILLVEILVTLADFLVEDLTRKLPPLERVLHTVLAINVGVVLTLLAPVLVQWAGSPTAVPGADHGAWAWWLSAASLGVGASCVRDFVAVLRLSRPPLWQRQPVRTGYTPRPRTVLVTGGTGFIGTRLCRALVAIGDRVIVATRDPAKAAEHFGPQVRIVQDLGTIGDDERIHAVVNLAGASIAGWPWTRARRMVLLRSRLDTTRAVVALIRRLRRAPEVLISASAVGRYGVHLSSILDESAPGQSIFQSRLCRRWEAAALGARDAGTRVCALRIGLVLGRDGGALPQMLRPLRFGLGALLGDGRQWVSWIHEADLTRIILFALDEPRLHGAVNATAPQPATHRQLMESSARVLRRRVLARVPAALPRIILGEMSQLLLAGQRVVPAALKKVGFRFHHGDIDEALEDLLSAPEPARADAGLEVFYSASCPVCSAEMKHYQRLARDSARTLTVVDIDRNPNALADYGLCARVVRDRLHVRDESGRLYAGVDAFEALWRAFPGYRWLVWALHLPGLASAASVLYEAVLAPTLVAWNERRRKGEAP